MDDQESATRGDGDELFGPTWGLLCHAGRGTLDWLVYSTGSFQLVREDGGEFTEPMTSEADFTS